MAKPIVEASGFLFIGDPHLASIAPGRRTDADFAATVCDKLVQAFAMAEAGNLQPVILGDLFHRETDTEAHMLTLLFNTLRPLSRRPWCLVGNHDLQEAQLTSKTALSAVAATGLLLLIEEGAFQLVDCGGVLVGLGGTPYGRPVPQTVAGLFETPPDQVIWITHTDIRFKQNYPGALEPFEITDCDLVINGHMHLEQPSWQAGPTLWVNPGNITRVSVDALEHIPGVLKWTPLGGLKRIPLVALPGEDVFDLRGRLTTEPAVWATGTDALPPSHFVEQLKVLAANHNSQAGTSRLAEDLIHVAREEKVSDAALDLLLSLLPEADLTELPALEQTVSTEETEALSNEVLV